MIDSRKFSWINTTVCLPVYAEGWTDPWQEIFSFLNTFCPDPTRQTVTFKILEGVSLVETGAVNLIKRWQNQTQFPSEQIYIECGNTMEALDYHNLKPPVNMFFFDNARQFSQYRPAMANAKRFAFFLGRVNIPRLCALHDINQDHASSFLLSRLIDTHKPSKKSVTTSFWPHEVQALRNEQDWLEKYDLDQIIDWLNQDGPSSIDNRSLQQQYDPQDLPYNVVHESLADHYHKFCIEVVAETMLYGNTFWPTEKIARPLACGKPFIAMAAPGFLKRLRCLGFQTYNTLWDESYDSLQGLERWQAIRKLIQNIDTMNHSDFSVLLQEADHIAKYNRKILLQDRFLFVDSTVHQQLRAVQ